MGLDYSYMLYFKKDLLWAALQAVVDIAKPHQPSTIICFPDHKLQVPLKAFGVSDTQIHSDDSKLEFVTSLCVFEDQAILDWQGERRPPNVSNRISVGTVYLTIYTDLCEYVKEGEAHEDILAVLRPISDLVLFNFGTTGSKMSVLFQESASIRTTLVELLERVPGVCGVFNSEDWGELFWLERHVISERIDAPYLLPGPQDDDRWEPEVVAPCK